MTTFLESILAFPTVFFTILLGVTLTYWTCVILGAVGVDILDGDVSGAAKAAGGTLEGAAKAAGGLLEGGAKGAAEGLLGGSKGAAEGLVGSAKASGTMEGAKAASGHDMDADGGGLSEALGFAGIPITISGSFVIFASWVLSLMGRNVAFDLLGSILPTVAISGGVALLSFVLGTLLASLAVRPLRPIFVAQKAPGRDSLMGRVCIINSGSVSGNFGHATFEDGSAGMILNVFCAKENQLKRGDQALILGYDPEKDIYEVEPVDWLLPEEVAQIQDPSRAAAIAARARDRAH
ncbi:hypothetical protein [Hyalangium rubrum]|uniref:DUF1449 family protein n=1 Tax=Hyalangium rubrum TaxID=3103134 RepID=A0ABU5HHK8_9BACT|nr:hypothetical protein [Hyalangium sp. s54d21]MDY7231565.1 hypothetical protein [Hyalangium sp. s54d21]